MGQDGDTGWDVQVEEHTVVVELGRRLVLDERGSQRLHDAISAAVGTAGVDRVVLLVDVEHPLGTALHDAVVRSAHAAAANGVTDWHIVAEHERKATAVAGELPRVETTVVPDSERARTRAA